MKQEGRDLTRFDLDYDLPDHFLPEYPPPIYLTTRPDLGDVSQGKVVTIMNYYELFNGILNPKQLEGLRLLVTPFSAAAVQPDRRPAVRKASQGDHLFRLPRERTYQFGHPFGGRHPASGVPSRSGHASSSRCEYPASLRFAAGFEIRRRLHGIRTARRRISTETRSSG